MSIWLALHLTGVVIGAGGALLTDYSLLGMIKDHKISRDEYNLLHRMGWIVIFGLLLLIFSGIGLTFLDPERYLASTKFLAKMAIVAVLTMNGVALHTIALPIIEKGINKHVFKHTYTTRRLPILICMGALSATSWIFAFVLGLFSSLPFSVSMILVLYTLCVATACVIGLIAAHLQLRSFRMHKRG